MWWWNLFVARPSTRTFLLLLLATLLCLIINMRWTFDLELWEHYELRNIEPNTNGSDYIVDKVRTYFPEWYAGLKPGRAGEHAAARHIRNKNSIRRVQIANHREGEGD